MPIISISNIHDLKNSEVKKSLTKKVFIADSCFVLDKFLERVNALSTWQKALEFKSLFFVNVNIRHELMDNIFKIIVGQVMYDRLSEFNLNWFLGFYNIGNAERFSVNEKWLKYLRKSNKEILKLASSSLGEVLDNIFKDFPYLPASSLSLSSNVLLSWETAEALIKKYYLGSSDAMIANFALSYPEIDGLITSDRDFLEIKEFENSDKLLIYVQK